MKLETLIVGALICAGCCQQKPADATCNVYNQMRATRTIAVAANKVDTGFFMGITSTSSIKVEELVGVTKHDPWRGLAFIANNNAAQVSFVSRFPTEVIFANGKRLNQPQGEITFPLQAKERAVVVTKLSQAELAPSFDRTKFVLNAGYGFPPADPKKSHVKASEQDVIYMKEAGLSAGSANCRIDELRKLDWIAKHGMTYITRENGRWWGGNGDRAGQAREKGWPLKKYDQMIADLNGKYKHSANAFTDICDEPSALDFPYFGEICARMINRCKTTLPYINIYPNYASLAEVSKKEAINQLGTKTYIEHVEAYCRNIPLDFICVDHYPIYQKSAKTLQAEAKLYDNLEDIAGCCRKTGRSMWWIGHVVSRPSDKNFWMSENNMRYQLGCSLAYGTERYSWCCWNHGWWENKVIDVDGKPTAHYPKLVKVNHELLRVIDAGYMRYRNEATKLLFFPKRGNYTSFSNVAVSDLTTIDHSQLAVGDMVSRDPKCSSRALWLFAANDIADTKKATHEITLRTDRKVKAIFSEGGELKPLTVGKDGLYHLKLLDCNYAFLTLD